MERKHHEEPAILFSLAREAIPNSGEDSWCYSVRNNTALIGVFDGSGGIGSRKYENYSGKSGAYVVSRAVAGAAAEWFNRGCADSLRGYVDRAVAVCKKYADPEIALKGSLRKDFPTTLSMMTLSSSAEYVDIHCFWAGDSRCYVLDGDGLHQITKDDVNTEDPMENLTEDGVLTNVVNASTKFVIHRKTLREYKPCLMISASDGCFGYLPSPMHFELMLLGTLAKSDSIQQWKQNIDSVLHSCAGDDYTMCVAGYGYSSFKTLRSMFTARARAMAAVLEGKDRSELRMIWEEYKMDYMWI